MRLKKCSSCHKDIPHSITICPYCRRDEQGRDTSAPESSLASVSVENQIREDLNLLAHDDPITRRSAADRISQKGPVVIPILTALLQEHTHKGMSEAARILGRLRDRRAAAVLIQSLKVGDEDLRTSAIWALCQLADPQTLDDLIQESERVNPAVQAYLAHVLAGYQDTRVVPALIKLAQNKNREVAFQGAWALGELGNSAAVYPLRVLLGRKDPVVRAATAAALRRLGGPVRRVYPLLSYAMAGMGIVLSAAGAVWWFYR
jgi:HEAT repeat protein